MLWNERAKSDQVIYVSDHGGSPRFYVKVRETAQRVWLRRIGERMVDGDWMYGHCVADPESSVTDDGDLWNAKERLFATEWDGRPATVYCD